MSRLGLNKEGILKLVFVPISICVVLFVLLVFNPASSGIFPPCPFHRLTGLYCPGCGSLRAVHQLLHGNLSTAFRLNPLLVLSLILFAFWLIYCGVLALRKRPLPTVAVPSYGIWLILLIIVLFWVLRNIRHHPFAMLAP